MRRELLYGRSEFLLDKVSWNRQKATSPQACKLEPKAGLFVDLYSVEKNHREHQTVVDHFEGC